MTAQQVVLRLSDIGGAFAGQHAVSTSGNGMNAGPGSDDSYVDARADFTKNEVAVDYNAGFTGVLAALTESGDVWGSCVVNGYAAS